MRFGQEIFVVIYIVYKLHIYENRYVYMISHITKTTKRLPSQQNKIKTNIQKEKKERVAQRDTLSKWLFYLECAYGMYQIEKIRLDSITFKLQF